MTIHSSTVQFGPVAQGSVAAGILALVERGVELRPELAREPGMVRLRFHEGWPAVLIELGDVVRVCDDDEAGADVEIRATLPDLVALLSAPLRGGVPSPTSAAGRAALGRVLGGAVEIDGIRSLARRVLRLLSLTA
jgi:hypothetical protein